MVTERHLFTSIVWKQKQCQWIGDLCKAEESDTDFFLLTELQNFYKNVFYTLSLYIKCLDSELWWLYTTIITHKKCNSRIKLKSWPSHSHLSNVKKDKGNFRTAEVFLCKTESHTNASLCKTSFTNQITAVVQKYEYTRWHNIAVGTLQQLFKNVVKMFSREK